MPKVLTARFDMLADTRAPGQARRLVTELLTAWGRESAGEMARLLVSEVVTNAVRHVAASDSVELTVIAHSDRVRIAVGDGSPRRPVRRHPSADDESGRGIHIVAALANQWGVIEEPVTAGGGKRVWFELADETTAAPARAS